MKSLPVIALINCSAEIMRTLYDCDFGQIEIMQFSNGIELNLAWQQKQLNVAAIIAEAEILSSSGIALKDALDKKDRPEVPFILICAKTTETLLNLAVKAGISEVFCNPVSKEQLQTKINFLLQNWDALSSSSHKYQVPFSYKTPLGKRIFDICAALVALLLLSPLFLLFALLIKLESKGPVFYYSLRAGTGYKIFKFYKFRSMYVNADAQLKDLKHLNQYKNDKEQTTVSEHSFVLCSDCAKAGTGCQYPMFADTFKWCEKVISKSNSFASPAFIKIKDDPRVTKIGSFMRNTSFDELPQLVNVFKGDMSIVGNRPLPLYEAEMLTTDKYALRFFAPSGLTGLWQVEKRGKSEMSEEERLMLDNKYAENYSLPGDLRLILKTIPALFQKAKV